MKKKTYETYGTSLYLGLKGMAYYKMTDFIKAEKYLTEAIQINSVPIQLSNLSFVTNFQYSQLVWSTIVNFLVFGVPFDYNKIVGVIGIIVFGIMFIRTEGKKN